MHTPLALYGTTHAHVFLLGAVEGVLPEPVRDDPVLDLRERDALRAAGLPVDDVMAMVKREQRSFEALLRGVSERLVIGVPDEIGGQDHLPSPYLERLGLVGVAPPSKPLASREEARRQVLREDVPANAGLEWAARPSVGSAEDATRSALRGDAVLDAARHAWRVEMRRESGAEADAFDGITGISLDADAWTFSATQLVALGQCGFKWFAARRLHLEEPDERDDAVGPALRGLLWHSTLELTLKRALRRAAPAEAGSGVSASSAERLRDAALAELEGAFADAEEQVHMPRTRAWAALRVEHLTALRRVVGGASFLPEGVDVTRLEARFHTSWRGLKVRGFVDRIDRTEDGLTLWDYKTSSSRPAGAKDADGKARVDVQLPLYVQAAAPALFPGEEVAEARYFSLTKNSRIGRAKIDDDELDALVSYVRSALEHGAYPVEPDVDAKACETCPFDLVCRVGPRIERKRAEREAKAVGSEA